MSNLLRCGLIAAGIVAAFAGGYFLRNAPDRSSGSAIAASPAAKSISGRTVAAPHYIDPVVMAADRRDADDFPPVIIPPIKPRTDAKKDDIDPAELQMIKRQMNIQTTVLDKSLPVPSVLAELPKVDVPPILPAIPDISLPSPPIAVGPGPLPPQNRPPPVAIPSIRTNDPFSPPTIPIPDLSPPKPPETPQPLPRKLLVNTRQIELDFAVTKTGLSKVKAVELWTTRDGGKTWAKTDRMEGSGSTFRTRLGSEGEYGFKMVFESESGQRLPEPGRLTPGVRELADLMLDLDTTPPQIEFGSVKATAPGHILVQWEARDRNLDRSSFRLSYSSDSQRWHEIEIGQSAREANNFNWKLPVGVPAQVHLSISVRDLAGNIGIATTAGKVSIDLIAPEGKITGVRAMGSEPEKGPMPRAVDNRQVFSFWTDFKIR